MIDYKKSYWLLAKQWQSNQLAIIRPCFFLTLLYIVQRTDFFAIWAEYPASFWSPNGLLTFFSEPFIQSEIMNTLLITLKISCILASIGFLYPFSSTLTVGLFFLITNYSHSFGYQGHVYMPIAVMGIPLVFSRAAATHSIDAWLFRRSLKRDTLKINNAALFNMKLLFCLIFCSAGLSKVMNGGLDWVTTDTLRNYLLRGSHIFQDTNPYFSFFSLGSSLYHYPILCHAIAAWTIIVELLSPLALLRNKRWYLILIPQIALLQIGAVFSIGVNFLPYLCLYIVWLPDLIRAICDLRKNCTQLRFKKTASSS